MGYTVTVSGNVLRATVVGSGIGGNVLRACVVCWLASNVARRCRAVVYWLTSDMARRCRAVVCRLASYSLCRGRSRGRCVAGR